MSLHRESKLGLSQILEGILQNISFPNDEKGSMIVEPAKR